MLLSKQTNYSRNFKNNIIQRYMEAHNRTFPFIVYDNTTRRKSFTVFLFVKQFASLLK